jgi:phosphatidylethanolamine-binding protein (PEBP) family uncharacterized protein
MSAFVRCAFFGAALSLLACSGSDFESDAAGGSGGAAAGGASGSATSGASAASGGTSGGVPNGGAGSSAGTATTGGGNAGVGGEVAGNSGSAGVGGVAGGAGGPGGGSSGNAGAAGASGGTGGTSSADFELTSPAFEHVEACTTNNRGPCNFFPQVNVFTNIGGMNQSPELSWGPGPNGTLSYVVCLHDTSANATHWCLWNIPAATVHLPANLARQKMPAEPAGASQDGLGLGGSGEGYVGPGARGNVYQFRLYALNVASYSPPNAEDRRTVYAELEQDPDDIVLATSTLRGRANPQ